MPTLTPRSFERKMSTRYSPDAIELCRKLYCRFGGVNHDAIQREMRKDYPGWSKQLLFDKGNGKDARLGWVTKFGFENSLKLQSQNAIGSVENDDERRYKAVVSLADKYQERALQGDEKAVPLFIKLTDQQIALRSKLDLSSANFETFVESFEQMVKWAGEIDTNLAKLFFKRKDEFIELAATHYGKRDI